MFFNFWAVGNGGRKSYEVTAFCLHFDSEDDIDVDMATDYIYNDYGPLPYSIRSVHWELIENPPQDLISNEIAKYALKIDSANYMIDVLKNLKKD